MEVPSQPTHAPAYRVRCLGLLNRRERWGLSARGWAFVVLFVCATGLTFTLGIGPFLAVDEPLKTDALVVEGWVDKFAIRKAAAIIREHGYTRAYVTGGPVTGNGGYVNDFQTAASVGARRLIKAGISTNVVQMVPCRVLDRDRTFASAVALREWMRANNELPGSINVLTEGFHARRTRLLFQEAFGEEVKVGVICVHSPDYNPKRWWRYSEGVRNVLGETIAYIYARFVFRE